MCADYFLITINLLFPLNDDILLFCRDGKEPMGTHMSQIVRAKQLYESAFHPDSGELQNVFGRMSFQMPGGCLVTGAMLQWYR